MGGVSLKYEQYPGYQQTSGMLAETTMLIKLVSGIVAL